LNGLYQFLFRFWLILLVSRHRFFFHLLQQYLSYFCRLRVCFGGVIFVPINSLDQALKVKAIIS
jgi:hypothetical protein